MMRTLTYILIFILSSCGQVTPEDLARGVDCIDSCTEPTPSPSPTVAPPVTQSNGCTVRQLQNGVTILCSDGTSAVILNGKDGTDGQSAQPTAYSVTEVYNPCGIQTAHDEVLLHLANGQWLAHYAGGGNLQYLALIGPGTYRTTDTVPCNFTITGDLRIENEYL